ncbi:1,6-anhydro-N-acetylmuramyl-L-alanine amidase AmpD [Marinobacter sp. 1_MG-2023]|uniref:1,6-anhydro-N-acetylmuramyl-L-alanine amidase AmpD n=1 Tax=Marinobacter sp. 1_MG-2023 TaxID=3062627 RepID=UPI0026E47237|nr:1,6-anhydro-N-acetylmuramyl-L-alanine amidase AmpD [Marinobacter sp. 1_MG-2023]MDO6825673.1 1,6-anhydro-N-acetylmuramyl-L-alanine amidase AmpD [Marinobacter sp. 1_MG-2023]
MPHSAPGHSDSPVSGEDIKTLRDTGRLASARWCPSPNYGARPEGAEISLLVVHSISLPPGQFGGSYIEDFFTNCLNPSEHPYFATIADMHVSAHALIRRDGSVVQFVSLLERAWHAGRSCFQGVDECNDFSIGIELEGADDVPYTPEQYVSLAELSTVICSAWPEITDDRITGHCDIAPGRKTDPGPAFDWQYFRASLQAVQSRRRLG